MNDLAVFALDPGTRSGVAWARVAARGQIAEALGSGAGWGSMTVEGSAVAQARQIERWWRNFRYANRDLPPDRHRLVIEDFILFRVDTTKKSGLDPIRVTNAFLGYRAGLADTWELDGYVANLPDPVYQQPGEAMRFVTNVRMRRWGIWVKGGNPKITEHQRDARRHLALYVAKHREET